MNTVVVGSRLGVPRTDECTILKLAHPVARA
jgi:hypothetical protein